MKENLRPCKVTFVKWLDCSVMKKNERNTMLIFIYGMKRNTVEKAGTPFDVEVRKRNYWLLLSLKMAVFILLSRMKSLLLTEIAKTDCNPP